VNSICLALCKDFSQNSFKKALKGMFREFSAVPKTHLCNFDLVGLQQEYQFGITKWEQDRTVYNKYCYTLIENLQLYLESGLYRKMSVAKYLENHYKRSNRATRHILIDQSKLL